MPTRNQASDPIYPCARPGHRLCDRHAGRLAITVQALEMEFETRNVDAYVFSLPAVIGRGPSYIT